MDVLSEGFRPKGYGTNGGGTGTVLHKQPEDFRGNRMQPSGALQIVVEEDPELLRNLGDQEIEVIEENTVGQVIQGEDGEYYVVVEDGSPDVSGLQAEGTAEMITNEDGTSFIVQNNDMNLPARGNYMSNIQDGYQRSHEGRRDLRTVLMDSGNGNYEMVQLFDDNEGVDGRGEPIGIGAITTAEVGETFSVCESSFPQGIKMRRNRVYGQCRCPECGQSFVNTARLERHLAVHQIFGSFLCPLCGKTYKYEYNLFYHWRRTCRDLNELVSVDDRRTMDVNALRQLVDDVAVKKSEINQIEIGINRNFLFGTSPYARLEMPSSSIACKGTTCRVCDVIAPSSHLQRHLSLHRGDTNIDDRSVCGGYFCDLCGLMFRQHFNLIKHWRTSCPEIQANLPEDQDITMDDDGLKRMVTRLMRRSAEDMEEGNMRIDSEGRPIDESVDKGPLAAEGQGTGIIEAEHEKGNEQREHSPSDASSKVARGSRDLIGRLDNVPNNDGRAVGGLPQRRLDEDVDDYDGKWADEQGILFADDFMEDDDGMLMGGDGLTAAQNRAKWSLSGGPVQCPECFRSFANSGRLERHLAGFHASFGSHHCILCGNRFKYDYNLLYHYRRSCPYTRTFIDHDIREQVDAMNLRKLVRNLAQKEVNLLPNMSSKIRLPYRDPVDIIGSRRQLLRYPTPANQPPPHLLVPRPGLGRGKSCPICSVIFYGNVAIERHLKAAHPVEYEEWNLHGLMDSNYPEEGGRRLMMQDILDDPGDILEGEAEEETEPPPTLTAELPVEQPIVPPPQPTPSTSQPSIRRAHLEEDEHGNQRLVDENGMLIEGADEDVQLQIDDGENLRQFIESVQLQVPDGEIIFVEENEAGGYAGTLEGEQIIESDGTTYVQAVQAREYLDRAGNVGKYYESKNVQFVRERSSNGKPVGKASDAGLEVAEILTGMKKKDPEKELTVQYLTGLDRPTTSRNNSAMGEAVHMRNIDDKRAVHVIMPGIGDRNRNQNQNFVQRTSRYILKDGRLSRETEGPEVDSADSQLVLEEVIEDAELGPDMKRRKLSKEDL